MTCTTTRTTTTYIIGEYVWLHGKNRQVVDAYDPKVWKYPPEPWYIDIWNRMMEDDGDD